MELNDKFNALKDKLKPVKKFEKRRAVKGDEVDKMWTEHLNKHQLDLVVTRTGPGKY